MKKLIIIAMLMLVGSAANADTLQSGAKSAAKQVASQQEKKAAPKKAAKKKATKKKATKKKTAKKKPSKKNPGNKKPGKKGGPKCPPGKPCGPTQVPEPGTLGLVGLGLLGLGLARRFRKARVS